MTRLYPRLCYALIICFVLVVLSACRTSKTSTSSGDRVTRVMSTQASESTPSPSPIPTQLKPSPTTSSTPTTTPTTGIAEGKLLFESRRQDTNGDGAVDHQDGVHIYWMDLKTGTSNQLTFGDHLDLYPSWSPDGSQIVFTSNRGGNYDIYRIDADGSGLEQLTTTLDDEEELEWSPDGAQIAYLLVKTLESGQQERHLYLMAVDGSHSRPLTTAPGNFLDPCWSPDGRFLAFTREQDVVDEQGVHHFESSVQLYEAETGSITTLPLESTRFDTPGWLPRDGMFLSVVQSPGEFSSTSINIYEVIWEQGQPNLLPVLTVEDGTGPYVWGPDGEWLIMLFLKNPQDTSREALLQSFDLMWLPLDFRKSWIESPYSLYREGILLTDNNFYDNYPDWIP